MGLGEALMKIVVKIGDVMALARRFREQPKEAMAELVDHARAMVSDTLQQVLDAEIELHLNEEQNRPHHVLDVAFEEDERGIREPWAAQNLAAVARLALALLERDDEKLSRTKKREFAALSDDYLLKLLSHGVD